MILGPSPVESRCDRDEVRGVVRRRGSPKEYPIFIHNTFLVKVPPSLCKPL